MPSTECVKVVVRCRPFNEKEKKLKCKPCVRVDKGMLQMKIQKPQSEKQPKTFTFDGVYGMDSTQKEIYADTAAGLIDSVMEGYNGTIFAYGQTGCGKTFTMEGVADDPVLRGIIPNSFDQIFAKIATNDRPDRQFLVSAAYVEIYNEEVRDLLGGDHMRALELKEDPERGVFIKGMSQHVVNDVASITKLMRAGNKNRSTGATLMNADSSRSHSLFIVNVESSEAADPENPDEGERKIRAGKLNLVDLAGSERQSKTQASGVRLKEATKINLSLSALGNVISALVSNAGGKKRHIPYRDSKLTRLLQSSLGGNTKTIMIAAISPADYNYDETLSTLRYANRAKNIKNKPKINEDPKDALLREYQDEISRLKALLAAQGLDPSLIDGGGGGGGGGTGGRRPPAATAASAPRPPVSPVNTMTQDESAVYTAAQRDMEEQMRQLAEEKAQHAAAALELEQQLSAAQQQQRAAIESSKAEHEAAVAELAERIEQKEAVAAQLAAEMKARERTTDELAEQLQVLQGKLISTEAIKEEKEKAQRMLDEVAANLQEQEAKQAAAEEARRVAEEERQRAEASANEIFAKNKAVKNKFKRLRAKYEAAREEVDDLRDEFQAEREGYLRDVRELSREVQLYKQICTVLLPPADLDKFVDGSTYVEERMEWQLPTVSAPTKMPSIGKIGGSVAGVRNERLERKEANRASERVAAEHFNRRPAQQQQQGDGSESARRRFVPPDRGNGDGLPSGWKRSSVFSQPTPPPQQPGSGRRRFSRERHGGRGKAGGVRQHQSRLDRLLSGNVVKSRGRGFGLHQVPLSPEKLIASLEQQAFSRPSFQPADLGGGGGGESLGGIRKGAKPADIDSLSSAMPRRPTFQPAVDAVAQAAPFAEDDDPVSAAADVPRRPNVTAPAHDPFGGGFQPATAAVEASAGLSFGGIGGGGRSSAAADVPSGMPRRAAFAPADLGGADAGAISFGGLGKSSQGVDPLTLELPTRRAAFRPAF